MLTTGFEEFYKNFEGINTEEKTGMQVCRGKMEVLMCLKRLFFRREKRKENYYVCSMSKAIHWQVESTITLLVFREQTEVERTRRHFQEPEVQSLPPSPAPEMVFPSQCGGGGE